MRKDEKHTVMIVDDSKTNIDILAEILVDDYEIMIATNGKTAVATMRAELPDLVLLDILMPEMDGFEVCRQIKADPELQDISVIFVTAMGESFDEQKGLEFGAVDYLIKPVQPGIVLARVRNHLELRMARQALEDHNHKLEETVRQRTAALIETQDMTIECLASLAETRDPETGRHIIRTRKYIEILIAQLQSRSNYLADLTREQTQNIIKASILHDIGKIGVPDNILLKPGKLTRDEVDIMQRHTLYGWQALSRAVGKGTQNSFLKTAADIAYTHHEQWDGSGYPRGLVGDEIPISGRLMVIADIYDALRTQRSYKPAFSHEKAVEIITVGDGRTMPAHFDPEILAAFRASHQYFDQISKEYKDVTE